MSYSNQLNRVFAGFKQQYPWANTYDFYGGLEINQIKEQINTIQNKLPLVNISYQNAPPISPQQGDVWYNINNGNQWFYDGTDWVSSQLFTISQSGAPTTQFISSNATTNPITNNIRVSTIFGHSLKNVRVQYLIFFFGSILNSTDYYTITCSLNAQSQTIGSTNIIFTAPTLTLNNNSLITNNQHLFITFDFSGKLNIPTNGGIQLINFSVAKVGSPSLFGVLTANLSYNIVY
jgi:hypothetical protein